MARSLYLSDPTRALTSKFSCFPSSEPFYITLRYKPQILLASFGYVGADIADRGGVLLGGDAADNEQIDKRPNEETA